MLAKRSTNSPKVRGSKIVLWLLWSLLWMTRKEGTKGGGSERLCNSLSVMKHWSHLSFPNHPLLLPCSVAWCLSFSLCKYFCPPHNTVFFFPQNSISLQSYLTNRFRSAGQLHSGPHQKPINHRYHTQLFFLPSLLLFWTQLDHWTAATPESLAISSCVLERGHSARRHTCRNALHYRWAARSNLFVLRWLQFPCHRTLGLQINIPGLSSPHFFFETGDKHTGVIGRCMKRIF